jgi:hypothetical protein
MDFTLLPAKCLDYRYLLFVFLLLLQKSIAYMPVFYISQVAHSHPFIKFRTGRFSVYFATKAGMNHGVENDAG